MSKHTPGPWIENGKSPSGYSVICRGPIIGWNIAVVMPGVSLVDRESQNEMEANAHLIAAAPELFSLAKLVLESQLWDGNDPNEEKWINFYSTARKVIAKAEGKEGKED